MDLLFSSGQETKMLFVSSKFISYMNVMQCTCLTDAYLVLFLGR